MNSGAGDFHLCGNPAVDLCGKNDRMAFPMHNIIRKVIMCLKTEITACRRMASYTATANIPCWIPR